MPPLICATFRLVSERTSPNRGITRTALCTESDTNFHDDMGVMFVLERDQVRCSPVTNSLRSSHASLKMMRIVCLFFAPPRHPGTHARTGVRPRVAE